MRILMILILFLVMIAHGQVDSLFSKRLSGPYAKNDVREIVGNIHENISSKDIEKVKRFCLENKRYGEYGIRILIKNDPKIVDWFKLNKLSVGAWSEIGGAVDSTLFYNLTGLQEYLFEMIDKDKFAKGVIYAIFANYGNLEHCLHFNTIFDFKNDYEDRNTFFKTQLRFKNQRADSLVNLEFTAGKSLQDLYLMIKYPIKKYNRYDFLPQLEELPKRVEEIRTPDNRYADKILKELKTLIPYLEQKKKENAQIGLPLDWGMPKNKQ